MPIRPRRLSQLKASGSRAYWVFQARHSATRLRDRVQGSAGPHRLQVGSGGRHLEGWINTDVVIYPAGFALDLRRAWPLPSGTLDAVAAEHVLANLEREAARDFLAEAHRCLQPGGVIRVTTPDLLAVCSVALGTHTRCEDIMKRHSERFRAGEPVTPASFANDMFRMWAHRYLYDERDLADMLRHVGFGHLERTTYGQSSDPRVAGIDQHPIDGVGDTLNLVIDAWA